MWTLVAFRSEIVLSGLYKSNSVNKTSKYNNICSNPQK